MAPVVELAAAWGGNYLCVYNHASLTKHSPALSTQFYSSIELWSWLGIQESEIRLS